MTDTGEVTVFRTNVYLRIIGFLFTIASGIVILFNHCPSNTVRFLIYGFFGLGLALVLAKSASKSEFVYAFQNNKFRLGGGVALVVGLIYLDPIHLFGIDSQCVISKRTGVTVFVRSFIGNKEASVKAGAFVLMRLNGEIKKEEIDSKAEAKFSNLQIGDSVKLTIESDTYRPIYPDSLYAINKNEQLELLIKLFGAGEVRGKVLFQETALPKVFVSIGALKDTTNDDGNYNIVIPDSLQADHYNVWFQKVGFKTESLIAKPQFKQELDLSMTKD